MPHSFSQSWFKVFGKFDEVSGDEILKVLFYIFEAGP